MAVANADGSIILKTHVDQSGLNKGMSTMKSGVQSLTGAFSKLGSAIGLALGVGALISFGKEATNLASDLEEVQNVVDVAFGSMTYKMEEFANTSIKTFGISKLTAKQTGSTFMAMAKGMGFAEEAASDMALTLTGLSADISSFYNISQSEAKTALSSVYTGETETLKRYGILITEVNLQEFARQQGITKSINAMTQQEKVMLRYNYVLQATQLAQGDFVRTQDSWANQTRILQERWKEFQTVLGKAFISIGMLVLPIINKIISALTKLGEVVTSVAQVIYQSFTGKTFDASKSQGVVFEDISETSGDASLGLSELGEATEKAGKQAQKSLASFDELNTISKDIGENASASVDGVSSIGTNSVMPNIDVEKDTGSSWITEKVKEFGDAFKGLLNLDTSGIVSGLKSLVEPLKQLGGVAWDILSWGFTNVIKPIAETTIKETLPRFLKTLSNVLKGLSTVLSKGFDLYKQFYDEFLKPISDYTGDKFLDLWDSLNEELESFVDTVENSTAWEDLKVILGYMYSVLEPIVEKISDVVFWVGELTLTQAWTDLNFIFTQLEDALGLVADVINGDFSSAWEHLKDLMIDNKIDTAKEKLEELKTSFNDLKDIIKNWVDEWKNKIKEMVDSWKEKIQEWWEDDVEPWFTLDKWKELFSNIGESLAKAVAGVGGFVETWKTKIKDWWDNEVSPWFTTEKWKELFNKTTEAVKNFFTAPDGFVQTWKTKIKDWWDNEVSPWFTVEKWKELGKNIKDGIVDGFTGAVNGIRSIINKILDSFQKLVNGAIDIVNAMISGWNKVANVTPGLKTISAINKVDLSKYKLPMLAQGAVLPPNKPFLSVVGDQKHGTNIEAPLDTIVDAMKIALSGANTFNGRIEVPVYIGSKQVALAVREGEDELGRQTVKGVFANAY